MVIRKVIFCFLMFTIFFTCLGGRDCSNLISIESSLAEPLIDTATITAKTYFKNLNNAYFEYETDDPISIYLSMTLADAKKLMVNHGNKTEAGGGLYVPAMNVIYTYLKEKEDDDISWNGLYEGIARYLVDKRFPDADLWFRYGLTKCLSCNASINNRTIALSGPCPKDSMILLEEDENGARLSIAKFFVKTDEAFESEWVIGKPFAKMLFCWINHNGFLKDYLINVYNEGCKLEVLEKTFDMSAGKINMEFTRYVRNECSLITNLKKAEKTDDLEEKESLVLEIINSDPANSMARMALARIYYKNDKKLLCRQMLEPLLIDEEKACYIPAAKLIAKCLYDSGDYKKALGLYDKIWERRDHYFYQYQIAYKIAGCYHYLNKPEDAAKWYSEFLDINWFATDDTRAIEYAEKYVKNFGN